MLGTIILVGISSSLEWGGMLHNIYSLDTIPYPSRGMRSARAISVGVGSWAVRRNKRMSIHHSNLAPPRSPGKVKQICNMLG